MAAGGEFDRDAGIPRDAIPAERCLASLPDYDRVAAVASDSILLERRLGPPLEIHADPPAVVDPAPLHLHHGICVEVDAIVPAGNVAVLDLQQPTLDANCGGLVATSELSQRQVRDAAPVGLKVNEVPAGALEDNLFCWTSSDDLHGAIKVERCSVAPRTDEDTF